MFDDEGVAGAELARVLTATRPEDLETGSLLEAIVAWEKLASWVTARQLASIAEFARRRPAGETGSKYSEQVSEFAEDELAAALTISRVSAGNRLGLALDLVERLPATHSALEAGKLSLPTARMISEGTTGLSTAVTETVEALVLPLAGERTPAQVRSAVTRAAITADPASAEIRHKTAAAERRVVLTPQPDGMATLWALMTADAAHAVMASLTATARQVKTPGDPRGVDARRVDVLVDLVTAPAAIHHSVISRTPAAPNRPAAAAAPQAGSSLASGKADTDALPEVNKKNHPPVQLQVVVGAGTLLGLDDQPAELAGHGPIPASLARTLAADATWRRLLTDPVSGALLDVGRTTYRPPAALADHVRARDRTCRFPGCRQPAARCDLDHLTPYPAGPTADHNLYALCRHHHRLKHETTWKLDHSRDRSAAVRWTSPTGRTYTTEPPPPLSAA
jgi:hypothetical protein